MAYIHGLNKFKNYILIHNNLFVQTRIVLKILLQQILTFSICVISLVKIVKE